MMQVHSNRINVFTHMVQSLWHTAIELHVLYHIGHIGPLTLVQGDEANLVVLTPSHISLVTSYSNPPVTLSCECREIRMGKG